MAKTSSPERHPHGKPLTATRLRELLHYEPSSGQFTWLPTGNDANPRRGRAAGAINSAGYLVIRINYKLYYGHRLAWLYVHGAWPERLLDHRNGVRSDCRLSNLRQADDTQNAVNRATQSNNTSGITGVSRWKNRWRAATWRDGKQWHLGLYDTAEDAAQAYRRAVVDLHGEFAPTRLSQTH